MRIFNFILWCCGVVVEGVCSGRVVWLQVSTKTKSLEETQKKKKEKKKKKKKKKKTKKTR
jgi:hypothetical protein